ncbi:MAG: SoxR reducing system RseC family protein [Christensenellaceae bacterium]|nr:SoxR reducing system RseC family protein [Christensenellaceae bacterium]
MIRTGKVVKFEKGRPLVCFDRLAACESCGACMESKTQTLVRVLGDADVGDIVEVALPDKRVLTLSVIMYILPILALIIGLFVGNRFFAEQGTAFLVGLGSLGVAFLAVKLFDNWLQNQPHWQPHIVGIHKENN